MEAEDVLYQALGVPGIVTPQGRAEAAAANLLAAANLAGSNLAPAGAPFLRATARSVLETVAGYMTSGALDGFLGGFSDENPDGIVTRVAGEVGTPVGASRTPLVMHGETLVRVALEKLKAFSEDHPEVGWTPP